MYLIFNYRFHYVHFNLDHDCAFPGTIVVLSITAWVMQLVVWVGRKRSKTCYVGRWITAFCTESRTPLFLYSRALTLGSNHGKT